MRRNIEKHFEAGLKRMDENKRDLKSLEVEHIKILSGGSMYKAILTAFYMGVEAGARTIEKKASNK